MKTKKNTSSIEWLNLDDTFGDDGIFGISLNDLDAIGEKIRQMDGLDFTAQP
jgi:hypothetical protein